MASPNEVPAAPQRSKSGKTTRRFALAAVGGACSGAARAMTAWFLSQLSSRE